MTPLPTPAELRELADECHHTLMDDSEDYKIATALRQFAALIEDAGKGVTEEVALEAMRMWGWTSIGATQSKDFRIATEKMHRILLAVAPHLALTHSLTKDKP